MNWLSRKLLQATLAKFFKNVSDKDIEVSMLGNQHLRLRNLELRTELVHSDTSPVLLSECRIGFLQLLFQPTKLLAQPIGVKISDVIVVLRLNEHKKSKPATYSDDYLKQYKKAVHSKSSTTELYKGTELGNLKMWLIDLANKKINLVISRVTVAFECDSSVTPRHYLGISIQEIIAKSRTIIAVNKEERIEEKNLELVGISLFTGVSTLVHQVEKFGANRQLWRLDNHIKKLYFARELRISANLIIQEKKIDVLVENLILNITPYLIKEINDLVLYIQPILKPSPQLRPGEGGRAVIDYPGLSQGSYEWWMYITNSLKKRIEQYREYNIVTNPFFRRYVFCVMYSIVAQPTSEMVKIMANFEQDKKQLDILNIHQYIMERIVNMRRNTNYDNVEERVFVNYILKSANSLNNKNIERLQYVDFTSLKKDISLENGKDYIHRIEMQNFSQFSVRIDIKDLFVFLTEYRLISQFQRLAAQQLEFKKQFDNISGQKEAFGEYVEKIYWNFIDVVLKDLAKEMDNPIIPNRWTPEYFRQAVPGCYGQIELRDIRLRMDTSQKLSLEVERIEIHDLSKICQNHKALQVRNLSLRKVEISKRNRTFVVQRSGIDLHVEYVCANMIKPLIEKIYFLVSMTTFDLGAAKEDVIEYEMTLSEVLHNKLFKSKYLKQAIRTETYIRVDKINLLLPMDYAIKNDILVVQVLGAEVTIVGLDLIVETQSTKILFVNTYKWVEEDNVFKRVIKQMEQPGSEIVRESIVMNLGPISVSKKGEHSDQIRRYVQNMKLVPQTTRFKKKTPDEFITKLIFTIPLIVIRISIKELFQLTYLINLWTQTGFTPQRFFKKKHITHLRKGHNVLEAQDQKLLGIVTQETSVVINAIAFSMATAKFKSSQQDTAEEDLFELFVNEIKITQKGFSISSVLELEVADIYMKNLIGHIPINRLVMLRFVESMLRNSDLFRARPKKKDTLMEMIGQGLSAIENDMTLKINLEDGDKLNSAEYDINLGEANTGEELLCGIGFRETERSKLMNRLLIYSDSARKAPFIKLISSTQYLAKTHQVQTKTILDISTLCFLMDPDFFKNMVLMYECTKNFVIQRVDNFFQFVKAKGYIPSIEHVTDVELKFVSPNEQEQSLLRQHNVIVDMPQTNLNSFQINAEQVNIMIYHKECIAYSILIKDFVLQIISHFLMNEMTITATKVVLMDTHPNAGEWPEMLRVGLTKSQQDDLKKAKGKDFKPDNSFELTLLMYKNDVIIKKNNCKTYMNIIIRNGRVTYLNKKIMELVNCIVFIVGKLTAVQNKFKAFKPKEKKPSPRFLFSIEIIKLAVVLPQNSLSKQHWEGLIEHGLVVNATELVNQSTNAYSTKPFNEDSSYVFEACEKEADDEIEFQSFLNENAERLPQDEDKVIVEVKNVLVWPKKMGLSGVYLINLPRCLVDIDLKGVTSVTVTAEYPLSLSVKDVEFQVMMRTFTQNFIEKTLVFDDEELRRQQRQDKRIDALFKRELQLGNTIILEQEFQQQSLRRDDLQPKKTSEVFVNVVQASFNMYGDDYNLSLIIHSITVNVSLYNDSSKDIDLAVETIEFYNNLTNRMFINSYDDDKDNEMGDLIYQPPPEQVFQETTKFTQEEKDRYVRRVCQKYKFNPRDKEDLDIHNQTRTTHMQGWSEDEINPPEKKYKKFVKCLKRVFCSCCNRKDKYPIQERDVAQLIVDAVHLGQSESLLNGNGQDQEVILDSRDVQTQAQLNKSYIVTEEEIIKRRFYGRNLLDKIRSQTNKNTFMTMMIHMCNTGEKNLQLILNNLNMAVSQHKELIYLANYIVKGVEQEPKSKIRKHLRYNNYPPLFLAMKMTNCKAIIGKSLDEDCKSYLQSIQDVVISQERMGDTTQGPGISKMKVEVKVVLNYCRYFKRRIEPIQLSRPINLIITQNSHIPLLVNTNVKHSSAKEVLVFGEDSKKVHIHVPLTYMKDIQNTITPLFPESKAPEGTVDVVFEKQQTPEAVLRFLFSLILDNMKVLVPGIIVQLLSGKKRSLLKLEVEDTYADIISVKSPKQHYGKMRIYTTVMAHYMNMKSSTFEPTLEPFKLCVKLKQTKFGGTVHKKFRIGSISGSTDIQNSLNINVSLSLIRNLKEAQTRYMGNYQIQDDAILDLTAINWNRELTEKEEDELLEKYRLKREFVGAFFGKKFLQIRTLQQSQSTREKYWNIKLRQYLVLHSFFDYHTGRKVIHIRTPFRIFNFTGKELKLAFRKKRTLPNEWKESLGNSQGYSIPRVIYTQDIIMTPSFYRDVMPTNEGYSLQYLLCEYEERNNFDSKHLSQSLLNRVFRLSNDNPKRFIRSSDFILECDSETLLGVTVKSCRMVYEKRKNYDHNKVQQQNEQRIARENEQAHETSILLLPPLIIRNELPMYLELFVDDKSYNLPASSQICITDLPKDFTYTTVSLKKSTISPPFSVFTQGEPTMTHLLSISETDSIGMRINKLSQLSRQIIIYSTIIIRNETYENLTLSYETRTYVIEKHFWLYVTDTKPKKKKRKCRIAFYQNPQNSEKFNTVNNKQIIKLQRLNEETAEEIERKLVIDVPIRRRQQMFEEERICNNTFCIKCGKCCTGCVDYLKGCCGCSKITMKDCTKCLIRVGTKCHCEDPCLKCFSSDGICGDCGQGCFGPRGCCAQCLSRYNCPNICKCCTCCGEQDVKMDPTIVVYDLVQKKMQSVYNISKTITLYYRFEIVNQSSQEMIVFHHNIELMRLEPKIRRHMYYYKSNSQWFRIALYERLEGKLLFSDLFKINEPRVFTVRIPKETFNLKGTQYPFQQNYLYTVRISEASELLFISIKEANMERFPVFFDNSTSYDVRILEGDLDFIVPPKTKIPFFFTNLDFQRGNQMMIEIEGIRKMVKMNEMSDMESFGLDEFKLGRKTIIQKSFKRGRLGIIFNDFHGDFNVVVDVMQQQLRIYDEKWIMAERVSLKEASFIDSEGNKIYIYLPDQDQLLLTIRNSAESNAWKQILRDCLAMRNNKRIFLTVDSNRYFRIIKLQETNTDDIKSVKKKEYEVFVKNISIAVISSQPAEIILLDLKNVKYERIQDLKFSRADKMYFVTFDDFVQVGKLKISNQIEDTANPVVLAQNRRVDYPCMEFKASKRFSVDNKDLPSDPTQIEVDDSFGTINHFTTMTLFLDELEIIMDSSLVMTILEIKREFEKTLKVYDSRKENPIALEIQDINTIRHQLSSYDQDKEIYINYFNIEPIKITMSVNWSQDIENEVRGYGLGFLGRLPFGIQSATIRLKSFTSYHVFEKRSMLMTRIMRYYSEGIIFQILNNAGSYDLLAPLRIINGVGEGARNIFYEPIYTLYKKKEVKATATKLFEGCIVFITFIFNFIVKLIDVLFRFFSFFALDSSYNQRRNNFHKHTMKNPRYGFRKGWKFLRLMVWEFFHGFVQKPKIMYERYGCPGIALGILIAIAGIVKVIVGLFDFVWAIGSGCVNFAYYEPQAMDTRSRPMRIFRDGTIEFYNYSEALAYEVMHAHSIDTLKNEEILFAKQVPRGSKHHYYIITNYRLIFTTENLSKKIVKFYTIKSIHLDNYNILRIQLSIPERHSYFFFTLKRRKYIFKIDDALTASDIFERLDRAIRTNTTEPSEPMLQSLARLT